MTGADDTSSEVDVHEEEEDEEQWGDVESAINNFLSEKKELKASLAVEAPPPPHAEPQQSATTTPTSPVAPPRTPVADLALNAGATSPHRPPSRSASSSRLLVASHAARPLHNPLVASVLAAAPSLPQQQHQQPRGGLALRSTDSVDAAAAVTHPQHSGGAPLNSSDSATNSPLLHPALSHRASTTRPLTQQGRRSSHTGGVALMPSLEEQLHNGSSSNNDLKRLWGGGGAAGGGNYVALSVRKLQQDSGPGLPRYARATASSLGGSGSLLLAAGGPGGGGGGGSGALGGGAPARRQSMQGEGFGGSGGLGPRPSTVAGGDGGRRALRASTSCLRLPSAGSGGGGGGGGAGVAGRGARVSVDGGSGGGGGSGALLPHGVLSNDGGLAGPPARRAVRASVDGGGGSRESSTSGAVGAGAYSSLRPHSNSGNGASTSDSGAAAAGGAAVARLAQQGPKGSPTGPLAPDTIAHISEGSSEEDEGDGPSRSDSSTGSLTVPSQAPAGKAANAPVRLPNHSSDGAAAATTPPPAGAPQQPQLTPRRSSAVSSRFATVHHLASTLSVGGAGAGGGSGRLADSAPHSPAIPGRMHGATSLVAHHQGRLSEAGAGALPAAASVSPGASSPRGGAAGGGGAVVPTPPNIPKPRLSASGVGQALGGVPAVPSPSRARMLQARSNSGLSQASSAAGGEAGGAGAAGVGEGF